MMRVPTAMLLLALAAPAAPAQGVDPILVKGRRADVLVYAPAARDSAAYARRLSDFVAGAEWEWKSLPRIVPTS